MMWQRVQDEFERHVVALKIATSNEDKRARFARAVAWVRERKYVALGTVLAVIATGGLLLRPAPAQQATAPAPALPAVVVETARLEKIAPQIALAGSVVSHFDAQLASEVSGRVAWVADVGTQVKQGDVVVKLDPSVAQMQLSSDKANVARLEAQLRYDRAQADRMQKLFDQNAIAKATRDQAISTRDVDVGALAQANAARATSEYNFEHEQIRAPFDGRVVQWLINPGEYATAGKPTVRLVDTGTLEVSAQAPIEDAQFVREGMDVPVTIDDRPLHARVRAIVPVGDQLSRTVEIRLTLAPGTAFVGDSAKVMIASAAPRDAIAVPRDALLLREEGTYVFKLDKTNTALRVAVETGSTVGDLVEVKGLLSPGERVVIRGGEHLEAGQKVRVKSG